MRILMIAALGGLAALTAALPAHARSEASQAQDAGAEAAAQARAGTIKVEGDGKNDKEDMGKADRVICRKIETIGSRLNAQRVCATAAQWSAMKQEGREGLDRIQTQRYNGNGG
ncbi:MAG: hypothetical protein KGL48_00380 [Sphingomonadales bacterium]|nr:hypothetical protein [Sphingomonadales bacterium]MDE2567894.1 hypothetical protein [Sphingomonadales bacterium]